MDPDTLVSAAAQVIPGPARPSALPPTPRAWLPAKAPLNPRGRLFSKNILWSRDILDRFTSTWTSSVFFILLLGAATYLAYQALLRNAAPITSRSKGAEADVGGAEQPGKRGGFLAGARERQALRRMLGREHVLTKRSSIVRITSSDPTSTLSERPMQVDLEPNTRRSFWPAPSTSSSVSGSSESVPSVNDSTPSKRSSVHGSPLLGSVAPRRRGGARGHSASPSPSRSPVGGSGGLPVRPTRLRPVSPLGRSTNNGTLEDSPAAEGVEEDDWADEVAIASHLDPGEEELLATPSMASEGSFTSASLGHSSSAFLADHLPPDSPTGSTFSISRAPSILKRRPQTFRTASLREIDISYTLMEQQKVSPVLSSIAPYATQQQQQQQQDMWQAQASGPLSPPPPPPYQPANSDLDAKARLVKLVEPDWRPHLDSHIRARERLDTASRFASYKSTGSTWSMIGEEDEMPAEDFWFERFTQSTAAAGRDWDWRKRRARLQRAAALELALQNQSQQPLPPHMQAMPGNVGKTDVQLQHQVGGETTPAAQAAAPLRKLLPSAPLITFTEEELRGNTAPMLLKVDTESGRRTVVRDASLSPTVLNGTPGSPTPSGTGTPMGGIFGAAVSMPSAGEVAASMAAGQRRRASEDIGLPKGVVSKAMRRNLSKSEGSPSGSPVRESPPAAVVGRRISSESSSRPSLDGRLGSMGRKVSLINLRAGLRRGSSSEASDFLQDTGSGMELVPNSVELAARDDEEEEETFLDSTTPSSPEGPRSSADAYSSGLTNTRPPPELGGGLPLSRTDSLLRQTKEELLNKRGSPQARSKPGVPDVRDSLDRDSVSQASTTSSDSLRRRLRSTSDSNSSIRHYPPLGISSSPPPVKTRVNRTGSRSSIMRSASGARNDLTDRSNHRRRSSTTRGYGSPGSPDSSRTSSIKTPAPTMQPEPAPKGMAYRARSASLSSTNSSLAGSRKTSRSASFNRGAEAGLAMTSGAS